MTVLTRAIGPSLSKAVVSGVLADPTLELHDDSGATIASNDNWKDSQQAAIEAIGIPPANDKESALLADSWNQEITRRASTEKVAP